MKGITKKLIVYLTVFALIFSMIPAKQTKAASQPYMEKLNVSWGLKKNKTVKFKLKYAGIKKLQTMTAKLTNYKITKAKKKGYKKLTFVLTIKTSFKPTKSQVHSMANSSYCKNTGSIRGGMSIFAVDYKTGTNVENNKKFGITLKEIETGVSKKFKKYTDNDDCYVTWPYWQSVKITIVYPQDYTDLCIGVGGSTTLYNTKNTNKFNDRKAKYGKTQYYSKKNKDTVHFMRVTE